MKYIDGAVRIRKENTMTMMKKCTTIAGLCLAVLMLCVSAVAAEKADYVFKNGAVYTIESKNPKAQAVAVTGKKISYVGSNEGVMPYVGKKTKVIDLKGKMLLPGFVDSHIHPTAAMVAAGANLQCDTVEQLLSTVKAWGETHPDAKVVQGFGWRYLLFPGAGPNKADLDRLFPDRPVFLNAIDAHSAWVNSKALKMAGVDAKTPDPVPGFSYFQRDPRTNEPTGWLVELPAQMSVFFKLSPPGAETVAAGMKSMLPQIAASGITAAFDAGIMVMPTDAGLELYQRLEKEGNLPIRIVASYYWNDAAIKDPVSIVQKLSKKYHSELVSVKALKINLDGGESQHTAVMLKPYFDRPGYNSDFILPPKVFGPAILKARLLGIDTHAHSYGDGATKAYLDAIEAARKVYPDSKSRHTAAHALFLTDEEITRLAKLNVTMSTSPQWFTPDPTIGFMMKILGEDLVFSEYGRINSVLKAGGRVAFGSDWPAAGWVSSFKPLDAVQVALTREILPQYGNQQIRAVLPPENERITLDQALKAYTLDAAYVLDLEDKIGSLKVGKLADIVIIDKDLHEVAPKDISTTKVDLTMMNGKITHRDGI
jgi:predicted amidohydrolase YtcJ